VPPQERLHSSEKLNTLMDVETREKRQHLQFQASLYHMYERINQVWTASLQEDFPFQASPSF
jgi:hypothetical protein